MIRSHRWHYTLFTAATIIAVVFIPVRHSAGAVKRHGDTSASGSHKDMVLVPAGDFIMGSNKTDASMKDQYSTAKPFYDNEHPRHKVHLGAYYIDKYEVTNAQYRKFVLATDYRPPRSWVFNGYLLSTTRDKVKTLNLKTLRHLVARVFRLDVDTRKMSKAQLYKAIDKRYVALAKEPVTYVSWYDAKAYCKWAGKRLPTEAEWEKAARGPHGNQFPWGNKWHEGLSNTGEESWDDGVAPVGSYKKDKSFYGVYDMAGNVMEWVQNWYEPYPGSDYHSDEFGKKYKVIRGAGWGREGHYHLTEFVRGGYRFYLDPDSYHSDLGFRCAEDAAPGPVHVQAGN